MKKHERPNQSAAGSASSKEEGSSEAPLERRAESNVSSIQGTGSGRPFLRRISDHDWLFGLLMVLAALMVYSPALNGKFLWDDDSWTSKISNLLQSFSGLGAMWSEPSAMQQYYPLTGTTFWIDHRLWGYWTLPYHVENVLLHAAAALLFWRLLRQLRVAGAGLAGAIFLLHPLMVESVAWITERKNTLSLVLYLGALLAYGWFTRFWLQEDGPDDSPANGFQRHRWRAYGLALLLFSGALLAKATAFSFPAAILLICWWKRGRIRWRADVAPTLPFFALAIGFGALTSWLEKHHVGASGADWNYSFMERCLVAGRVLWFYVGKLLWPVNLCFDYPQWHLNPGSPGQWLYSIAAIVVLSALWLARARIGRGPITAVLFFVGTLFPVLGFMNAYYMRFTFVCDHLVYLSSLGLIALGAALVAQTAKRFHVPGIFPEAVVIVLMVLAMLTWRQCKMYTGPETLWRTTIVTNPEAWMARENLAGMLLENGHVDEAISQFQKSLEIQPRNAFARNGLGVALAQIGRVDEAIAQFQKAVEIEPNNPAAQNNFAVFLFHNGQLDEAMSHFQRVLEIEPNNAFVYGQLGDAFLQKGQTDEAVAHFRKSLSIDPNDANVQADLGNALLMQGQVDEGMAHCQKALEIDPDNPSAQADLGNALLMQGRVDQAIAHYQASLKIKPNDANVHANLGNALLRERHLSEAVAHYRQAVEIVPDNISLLNTLARILAASPDPSIQNGAEAVELAQRADQLSGGKNPGIIATLAAAEAGAGQFAEAVGVAQHALELATAQNNTALINILQMQIKLYRANQPFRDPSLTNAPSVQEQPK